MKPEYAIEVLQRYKKSIESDFSKPEEMEPIQAYCAAIEALEKQIPKKPVKRMKNPDGTDQFSCAVCGRLWWEKDFITKFCDGCGTAVDREA